VNKKKEYLKAKIEEHEINSEVQFNRDYYRGISDFKKGYQPRTNIIKDEKGDLVTDSHSILARWRIPFSQLFNVHGVNDIRQKEILTAEPLVPEPNAFEVEMAVGKLKDTNHWVLIKSQQKRIKQGVEQFALRSINLLILFSIRRNCLINEIMVIIEEYHFCKLRTKLPPTPCCHG
jgi:hypothetical protein